MLNHLDLLMLILKNVTGLGQMLILLQHQISLNLVPRDGATRRGAPGHAVRAPMRRAETPGLLGRRHGVAPARAVPVRAVRRRIELRITSSNPRQLLEGHRRRLGQPICVNAWK